MRWILGLLVFAGAATALVLACTGGGGDANGSSSGAANDGAATTSDGGPEGSPVDAGPPDDRILPLTVGRKWTYDVVRVDGGPVSNCMQGTQTAEVIGPGDVHDGGPTVRYKALCIAPLSAVDVAGSGDRLVAYPLDQADAQVGGPVLYLDAPVEEGHQWTYASNIRFEWNDAGTVTVPAGTFSECWTRTPLNPDPASTVVIYCRGVGQVRHLNPSYTAELTSKNF